MAELNSVILHLELEERKGEFAPALAFLQRVKENGEKDSKQPTLEEFHNMVELHKLFPVIEVGNTVFFGAP